MISFLRLVVYSSFLILLGLCDASAAEHTLVVPDISQDKIVQMVQEGIRIGIEKGLKDARIDSIPWGKLAAVTIVGGGSYVLFNWLRKKIATSKQLNDRDRRVNDHLHTQLKNFEEHFHNDLQNAKEKVENVGLQGRQLGDNIHRFGERINGVFLQNFMRVGTIEKAMNTNKVQYDEIMKQQYQELADSISLVGIAIIGQSRLPGIKQVSGSVEQLSKDMNSNFNDVHITLKLQRKIQDQQHTGLLSDIEDLAQSIPKVQELITENGTNVQEILKGIQELQAEGKERDEKLNEFVGRHDRLLSVLSEQKKEQQKVVVVCAEMDSKLNAVIGTLLLSMQDPANKQKNPLGMLN